MHDDAAADDDDDVISSAPLPPPLKTCTPLTANVDTGMLASSSKIARTADDSNRHTELQQRLSAL